jgi:hypothetical protein
MLSVLGRADLDEVVFEGIPIAVAHCADHQSMKTP